jgi:NAD(P)-dependent dehydrogenase (short-subunit alcohol dehydrogenase family)
MRNGFSVVLNGRRKEPLEAGAVEGRAFGSEAIAVAGDVTDPAFVKALFGEAKAAFCRVDVLFNNAGVFSPAVPFEEVTAEQWNAAVAVNLTAAFLCTQEAFRSTKPKHHAAVVSSITAPYPRTRHGRSPRLTL